MKYLIFKNKFKEFPVINLNEVYKIDPAFDRRRLFEWQKYGYLNKIRNGYYMFSDTEIDENMLFIIANNIYRHSYVSLESALGHYNLIPEQIFATTSVSTKKRAVFETCEGVFRYHMIKEALFWGYRIEGKGNYRWKIATPEKAIIDYLYLNPDIKNREDVAGIRINSDVFNDIIELDTLKKYSALAGNQRVKRCLRHLLKEVENAQY